MSEDPPTRDATAPLENRDGPPRELERGTCVGRYVLLGRLGQGGMGIVYRAYDPELDRPIALKLLRAMEDGLVGSRQDRLLREAQALARLQHPNVIAVHDVGTFRGDVFIAMELVEGASLHRWLKESERPRAEVLAVFLAAGEGLAAAHRAGLVHRDFKPDNVMVGDDGRIRVLDFGLARVAQGGPDEGPFIRTSVPPTSSSPFAADTSEEPTIESRSISGLPSSIPSAPLSAPPSASGSARISSKLLDVPLTQADAIVGTPRFMSPEQAIGIAIDPRADQFSFCVALYQAVYGSYPFNGTPHDAVRDWTIKEAPAKSTVPRWLRTALVRGLAEKPVDCFGTMPDLLAALRADPSARRQRFWRAAGAIALAVTGIVAFTAAHRQRARVCEGAERELTGVWDDARRAAVRTAFKESHLPYAEAALSTVERTLDAYAHAWTAMHVDVCEATHIRGEQSQELLDLRMACLSDRRTELKTLSDLFVAAADVGVVEHAAQSAESLPGFDACADVAALKAPVPPPRDPRTLAEVTRVREELARTRALDLAAKYDEGIPLGKSALAEAVALGYAPVIAEAELSVGALLGGHGDYAESARAFQRSYVSALAGRHDEIAARAAADMVIAIGTHQAHYEEGDRWAEVAEALAGRMQRKDELLGTLYSSRSSLREREGRYDDAMADVERALAIEIRIFGPEHFSVAESYCHLGAVHYSRAEYAPALEAYGKCKEIQSRLVGPDHPLLIGARVGIADVYGDSGDHERALTEYESALAAIRRARPGDPDIPMIQNNLGGELQQLGRPAEAFAQYQLALRDWQKRVGTGREVVTALSNMGEAKLALGQPVEALDYYQQALAMCDPALGAGHPACARLSWGMGESYRRQGKLGEALDLFQRSLALAEKALGPKHPQLTAPLLGIGRVDLARNDAARAKEPLERALSILGAEPGEGLTLPDTHFALAQAAWATGDEANARALAGKAREEYTAAGLPGRSALAELATWPPR